MNAYEGEPQFTEALSFVGGMAFMAIFLLLIIGCDA